ncbi:hypothetical protein SASPL_111027 [Salvia splendens]|uniref:No apical meristem-associated C-terminal domain-containing protein n=1 Tax=Salvia splendens TaxID=180675 RepID=A0A8X9A391_SALSN|nr:hypothetical protein SASPL_111027 [Salvia splendens]
MPSWVYASVDSVRGKHQKGDALWSRWKRLNENANKWVVACREANARRRSGMSDQDVENEAHGIYQAGGCNKYQDLIVFNEVMSKHQKWSIHDTTQVFPDNENVDYEQGETRQKEKEKSKVAQFDSTNAQVAAELHALRLAKDNENELVKARLQIEHEKLEKPSMKMYQKMLIKLLDKEHLSPEDQEMKHRLMEIVFGK